MNNDSSRRELENEDYIYYKYFNNDTSNNNFNNDEQFFIGDNSQTNDKCIFQDNIHSHPKLKNFINEKGSSSNVKESGQNNGKNFSEMTSQPETTNYQRGGGLINDIFNNKEEVSHQHLRRKKQRTTEKNYNENTNFHENNLNFGGFLNDLFSKKNNFKDQQQSNNYNNYNQFNNNNIYNNNNNNNNNNSSKQNDNEETLFNTLLVNKFDQMINSNNSNLTTKFLLFNLISNSFNNNNNNQSNNKNTKEDSISNDDPNSTLLELLLMMNKKKTSKTNNDKQNNTFNTNKNNNIFNNNNNNYSTIQSNSNDNYEFILQFLNNSIQRQGKPQKNSSDFLQKYFKNSLVRNTVDYFVKYLHTNGFDINDKFEGEGCLSQFGEGGEQVSNKNKNFSRSNVNSNSYNSSEDFSKKKTKEIILCPHVDRKHYAKNMCNNCYHKQGRKKKAWACPHTDAFHYAKGKCQTCYISNYHREHDHPSQKNISETNKNEESLIMKEEIIS
jgi:hypothetical protein